MHRFNQGPSVPCCYDRGVRLPTIILLHVGVITNSSDDKVSNFQVPGRIGYAGAFHFYGAHTKLVADLVSTGRVL